MLLRSDGTAVAVGDNTWGQLNIPEPPAGVTYTQVAPRALLTRCCCAPTAPPSTIGGPAIPELPTGATYTQVAAGGSGNAGYDTVLLRSDGTAVAVGDNCYGQINIPGLPTGVKYTQVAAGDIRHTVLLRSDGTAVAIGDNPGGQLNIPALPAGVTYTQVDAGQYTTRCCCAPTAPPSRRRQRHQRRPNIPALAGRGQLHPGRRRHRPHDA